MGKTFVSKRSSEEGESTGLSNCPFEEKEEQENTDGSANMEAKSRGIAGELGTLAIAEPSLSENPGSD
jgi:hypothetical protein